VCLLILELQTKENLKFSEIKHLTSRLKLFMRLKAKNFHHFLMHFQARVETPNCVRQF